MCKVKPVSFAWIWGGSRPDLQERQEIPERVSVCESEPNWEAEEVVEQRVGTTMNANVQ